MSKSPGSKRGLTAQRAEQFGVDPRTVRAWRRDGAPLDDDHKLKLWLAGRRRLIAERKTTTRNRGQQSRSEKSGEMAGAAAALRRLERAEVRAYADLQEALNTGDPLAIKAARENWLKIGDSLRRYDLLVEQSRRDLSELRPVSELIRVLRLFVYGVRLSLRFWGDRVANDAFLDATLPLFAEGEEAWFAPTLRKELWPWINHSDEAIRDCLALYLACLEAIRKNAAPDDEEPVIRKIVERALARIEEQTGKKTNEPKGCDENTQTKVEDTARTP